MGIDWEKVAERLQQEAEHGLAKIDRYEVAAHQQPEVRIVAAVIGTLALCIREGLGHEDH